MKITVVENPPVDPREFDLPEGFSEENIEDVVEIFNTPLIGHYNWDYTDADTRIKKLYELGKKLNWDCLLYTSPSPRDATLSRMPSSA